MPIERDQFVDLISTIVHSEMDEDEQAQFDIEGPDMFDSLFDPDSEQDDDAGAIFRYGISPEALTTIKVVTEFGALIISCITLYLKLQEMKDQGLKKKMDKLELVAKLKTEMLKQEMPAELAEKINKKYADRLSDLLDDL